MLEKVPTNLEARYKDLVVYISIKDEINVEYFDDEFKGGLKANFEELLTINTDLPVKTIIVYTWKPLETVIVNNVKKTAIKEAANKYRIKIG